MALKLLLGLLHRSNVFSAIVVIRAFAQRSK